MRDIWDLYSYDQAVWNPEDFVGRQRELGEVLDSIRSGNCVQIVGPRRIGKSSLLLHLTRLSTLRQRIPNVSENLLVYVDLQGLAQPTEGAFWATVIGRTRARIIQMHAQEDDAPPLPSAGQEALAWAADLPPEASSQLSYGRALELLEELRALGFTRLTLLMDELEVLGRIPSQGDLLQRLRALAGNGSWPMTFVTTSRAAIATLTHDGRLMASPFFNIFSQTVRLGAFDAAEMAELVNLPRNLANQERIAGWVPGLDLAEHLTWITWACGSHPFYSTVACRRLLRHKAEPMRDGEGPIALSGDDLQTILGDLSDDLGGQIDAALADRSQGEQDILRALAHGEPKAKSRLSPEQRRALVADGLITDTDEGPAIAAWLVVKHLDPPKPSPPALGLSGRQIGAIAALIGALVCVGVLADELLGPLPRGSEMLDLDQGRIELKLNYPTEVRLQEEAPVEVSLTAKEGGGGTVHVSLVSLEGGLAFTGGEVERSWQLTPMQPTNQVWQARIEPRPVDEDAYSLMARASWRAENTGRSEAIERIARIEGRALSGAKVIFTSTATLLLGILGFIGLNPRSLTGWFIELWGRLGRKREEE